MISIISATYNCSAFIEQTIMSVQQQTYPDWEMIIIDDSSTDNTLDFIKAASLADTRIKYLVNDENMGPAKTRNRGIEMATGNYMAFLDGDDLWLPEFLAVSLDFMEKNNYRFIFSSYRRVDVELNPLYEDFIVPKKVSYHSLLKTCPISCLTAVINIGVTGKFYMPDIAKRQDYGLWLSILRKVDFAYGIQQPLAIYRMRKNSISRNKYKAMLYVWKVYRDLEKLDPLYSSYLMVNYVINGLKKYGR
ncbi:glycosyltransferase family 2 protein [Pedobacter psychroterrae]|uniref:Glycosyltransferase family 2 protein n=1 Tax=Pedobacter psychroterrae TaxID=2530453 RepID=A0A4R0N9I7_9SPHI|nr:glycosyltransferase family 2 protein [Pedobacter psychroterrae]TCC96820.1 glycosyltransferase family 2 protein [Pedobacter psychroterrae]